MPMTVSSSPLKRPSLLCALCCPGAEARQFGTSSHSSYIEMMPTRQDVKERIADRSRRNPCRPENARRPVAKPSELASLETGRLPLMGLPSGQHQDCRKDDQGAE